MSGNLLQEIVSSYVGALVQREHIKNKRLDDIMTTSGNHQQASVERLHRRLDEHYGSKSQQVVANEGPSEDYGRSPRQLGVTPYPQPPSTTQVLSSDTQETRHPGRPDAADAKSTESTESSSSSPEAGAKELAKSEAEVKPKARPRRDMMSPVKAAMLGAGLTTAGLAAGGTATYLLTNPVRELRLPPLSSTESEAVAESSSETSPQAVSDEDRRGAVDILVR
ncbi:MAG: hypothetical protein AAF745_02720 [Planctomycetota bacterium]